MEEESGKKRGITINWSKLHDDGGRDPLENVIIAGHPPPQPPQPERPVSDDRDGDIQFEGVSDRDLEERITRQQSNLEKLASKMRDNGEKLRVHLKQLEDERERRKASRVQKDTDKWEKPKQAVSSRNNGGSIDFREEATAPLAKSMFVSCFERKLEDNSESMEASEFQRESSLYPCNRRNTKSNGDLWPRGGKKGRNFPRHCYSSYKRDKCPLSDGGRRGRASSPPFHQVGQDLCSGRNMSDAFQVSGSRHSNDASRVNSFRPRDGPSQANGSKPGKGPTIVVVDEEEPQPMDATEQEEELPDSMSNAKIYYPARNDPKSVEICFADIKCLDPGSYLTSNIMNFYIRYLQQQASPTDRAIRECHFFNTFFYEKLKKAVSYEGKDKDECFGKFRRWWKGVNLFEKAYVLIPINEDVHWSLVIICIPDKEDEAGPIVLHLDSLGIHSPRSVFQNIKSYLKEEWSYLDREVDLSISGGTWEQLPEKIEEKKLSVPQQKNEYDCGLFVLFFMERFIEEAPPRLRKKDLTAMFGRRWFKPEEASSLRRKIRKLLIQEFRDAQQANPSEESAPSVVSSKDSPFEFTDV